MLFHDVPLGVASVVFGADIMQTRVTIKRDPTVGSGIQMEAIHSWNAAITARQAAVKLCMRAP